MMKLTDPMEDPQKQEIARRRHFSFRINAFFFAIFLLFSILIVRLAFMQFVEGKQLSELGVQDRTRATHIAPIRGNIFDSDGYPIASTYSVQSVFYRYGAITKPEELVAMAKKLEWIFAEFGDEEKRLPAGEILKRMDVGIDMDMKETTRRPGYSFIPRKLKSDLSKTEIAYIMEHRDELAGLEIMEESARIYDQNKIAVQLVGYVRPYSTAINQQTSYLDYYKDNRTIYNQTPTEYVGFDGLEFMYQEQLRGSNGMKVYPVNAADKIIGPPTITQPVKGHNLILTIQSDIQLATQRAIEEHLEVLRTSTNPLIRAENARSGFAVAMEVDTGNVVAMASMPDYDPNVWVRDSVSTEQYNQIKQFVNNGTIRAAYPDFPEEELKYHTNSIVYAGSVIKPLTVLLGLSRGYFTTTYQYNDVGYFYFGRDRTRIQNDNGVALGRINVTEAIRRSSNTFMSELIGNRLALDHGMEGLDIWDEFMKKFGLGVLTGSGLPNEIEGILDYYNNVKRGNDSYQSALVRASWGQQAQYTTLQLAQFVATMANRGKRPKPQFVKEIRTYEGDVVEVMEPEFLNEEEFPNEYWNAIFTGMKGVYKDGFDGFPYDVAAKTGTSTQAVSGGTVANAVFVAFAPLDKPKLAVAVVIPEGGYGSRGAAPIARKIFDAYDQVYGLTGTPVKKPDPDLDENADPISNQGQAVQ